MSATWRVPSTTADLYRHFRKVQRGTFYSGREHVHATPATNALNIARTEMALREAERNDLIRFDWTDDYDYEPDGDYDIEHERKMLSDGSWVALVCFAYVNKPSRPHSCPSCSCEMVDREEIGASLGGIVIDVDDKHEYKREIERELFEECQ